VKRVLRLRQALRAKTRAVLNLLNKPLGTNGERANAKRSEQVLPPSPARGPSRKSVSHAKPAAPSNAP